MIGMKKQLFELYFFKLLSNQKLRKISVNYVSANKPCKIFIFSPDYEDDEWPEDLGETKTKSGTSSLPHSASSNTTASSETLKRFAVRKKTDSCLYNMASLLGAVGAGFDIRVSNESGVHPSLESTTDQKGKAKRKGGNRNSAHIGQRRDAYLAAVRDSFIEPSEFQDLQFNSTSGYMHNTYHGQPAKYRPSVNFDMDDKPIRFMEAQDNESGDYHADVHNSSVTPSSDNRTTPSADSHYSATTTPSFSGASFSGASSSMSPRAPSSDDNHYSDLALISLSPSQDKNFIQIQRQLSDTSSSVFETPMTTPKTTPQRYNVKFDEAVNSNYNLQQGEYAGSNYSPSIRSPSVKFDDNVRFESDASQSPPVYSHRRSPSNTSNTSLPGVHEGVSRGQGDNPASLRPPPMSRRQNNNNDTTHHGSTAERPVTLDIIPRPRPNPVGILKRTSPAHTGLGYHCSPRGKITPTPELSGGEDYQSSRSGTSPGSTPPHIEHQRTLLDIDVEGQSDDKTRPLPAGPDRKPTIQELEKEFLESKS